MAQQVFDRDRAPERIERKRRLAAFIGPFHADLHVGEGKDVFCNGIIERKLAVFDQHHRRD